MNKFMKGAVSVPMIVGIVLALGVVGGVVYTQVGKDGGGTSDSAVLENMYAAHSSVTSQTGHGSLELGAQMKGTQNADVNLLLDFTWAGPGFGGDLKGNAMAALVVRDFDFKEGDSIITLEKPITLNLRSVAEVAYIQATNLPPIVATMGFSSLEGAWIKFDPDEFLELYGLSMDESGEEELMDEQMETFRKLMAEFQKYDVIEISGELSGETIAGVATSHYSFEVNQDELKKFLTSAMPIFIEAGGSEVSQEELDALKDALDKSPLGKIEGEIWVGTADNLLRKITAQIPFEYSQDGEGIDGKAILTLEADSYNTPVVVEAPSPFVNFSDLLGGTGN